MDPKSLQNYNSDITFDELDLGGGKKVKMSVSIIEWKVPTKRVIHLCDANGVFLHETESGVQVRAPGFDFTADVKCDHFRTLDKDNLLVVDDLHPDVNIILKSAKAAIKDHFRKRLAERQSQIVQRWKEEQIYPYVEKEKLNPVEEAERQVFDILAVNLEAYLPDFEGADTKSRRFTFRLLSQALKENPESVQQIITDVLNLKKEEQEDLAELLSKTPLSAIISSAKIVANRLDFILALENLLFDKETKKKLLERDQLHKILENEAWIFHEEFALAGSEQRLEEVLNLHLEKLGQREDNPDPVLLEGGKKGRIDLLLNRVTQPRHDEYDYLVVELKRPSQPINSAILSQIESYAIAVASEPRFQNQNIRWRFMVVANEMDDHAKRKANQGDRQRGVVYVDSSLNIVVLAKTWSEVLADARTRLSFVNAQLEEWFEDRVLYHMIGFLIASGMGINDLRTSSSGSTKSEFEQWLRGAIFKNITGFQLSNGMNASEIQEKIEDTLGELDYDRDPNKIRLVLLLFNLATLLQNKRSNLRFQFDSFKNEEWNIEHVRSVTSDKPERHHERLAWLTNCLGYLKSQEVEKTLQL